MLLLAMIFCVSIAGAPVSPSVEQTYAGPSMTATRQAAVSSMNPVSPMGHMDSEDFYDERFLNWNGKAKRMLLSNLIVPRADLESE